MDSEKHVTTGMVKKLASIHVGALNEIDRLRALLVTAEDARIASVPAVSVAQYTVRCCRDTDQERLREMESMQQRYQIAEARAAKYQAYAHAAV